MDECSSVPGLVEGWNVTRYMEIDSKSMFVMVLQRDSHRATSLMSINRSLGLVVPSSQSGEAFSYPHRKQKWPLLWPMKCEWK